MALLSFELHRLHTVTVICHPLSCICEVSSATAATYNLLVGADTHHSVASVRLCCPAPAPVAAPDAHYAAFMRSLRVCDLYTL